MDPFIASKEPIKVLNDPKLVALKAKRREELREEFLKQRLSPYTYIHAEAKGTIFDPVMHRYVATTARLQEYWRPNVRNTLSYFGFIVLPIFAVYLVLDHDKAKEEHQLRTGQIKYADRHWKFQ